jgi:hypothetical protein
LKSPSRSKVMIGVIVLLVWILGFATLGVASVARLLAWRSRVSAVAVGGYVDYLIVSLAGMGLGVCQLLTTSVTRLAAPVEGALLVEGVGAGCIVLVLAVREMYVWSIWRLARRGPDSSPSITQEQYT